jgi:hypothetical protein
MRMTIEVYDDDKLVIGCVVSKNARDGIDLVRKYFPEVASINTQGVLPKNDKRLKMIAPDVYRWDWNFDSVA